MRWLLAKDLRILRRSPLLLGLLVVYPVAVALMIGFALSSPPGRPKVAFFSEVAPGRGRINLGSQQIDVSHYASELFRSVTPIRVRSREAAIAKVRSGQAIAALIIPGDIAQEIESLVTEGFGTPTVELYLNSRDPIERDFANGTIDARLAEVEQAVSRQVLRLAIADLQQVLNGGKIQLAGENVDLLGLRSSRTIVQRTIGSLPRGSRLRPALDRVVGFANLAIQGLAFASPVLGSIGQPLTVARTQLSGATTPTATYAAAIAVVVSLMIVGLLLAAGMLALERSENTYTRLVRGGVTRLSLLVEKVVLSAACAAALALLMSAGISAFVHLEWGRVELWILALVFGACAFGALGVALGALAREVSVASLLVVLLALPIAFVALVPRDAVSGALHGVLDVVAFVFPFRATLEALGNAFSGTQPGILGPLVHLLVLTGLFVALARAALVRFANRLEQFRRRSFLQQIATSAVADRFENLVLTVIDCQH